MSAVKRDGKVSGSNRTGPNIIGWETEAEIKIPVQIHHFVLSIHAMKCLVLEVRLSSFHPKLSRLLFLLVWTTAVVFYLA